MITQHLGHAVPPIHFDLDTVQTLHQNYLRTLRVRRRSERHLERVDLSLRRFEEWLGKVETPLLSIDFFEEYALWLMDEARPNVGTDREGEPGSLSPVSQRGYLADLRAFVRWAVSRGYLPEQAKSWVPVPRANKQGIKRASNTDMMRMLRAAQGHIRNFTICCLLLDCGLRAGELAKLRIENCDLIARTLSVMGKTGYRTVAISEQAAEVLKRWLVQRQVEQGWVFPGRKDGHLSARGIYEITVKLREKADVQGRVNPHAWRHAYISNTAVRGGNAALTQIQAGHSSISTTEAYFGFGVDELREYQDRVTSLPELIPDDPLPEITAPKTLPRPTSDELRAAIQACPNWEELGRRYGVSGVAVKKWAKKWDLVSLYSRKKSEGH